SGVASSSPGRTTVAEGVSWHAPCDEIAVSRPMRVMLVADAVGGVWDFALSLAGGLIHYAGASVLLVAVGPPPDAPPLAAAAAPPGLEHRILDGRLEWMEGGREWLAAWRRGVAAHAAEWKAEVVHVNQLGLAA